MERAKGSFPRTLLSPWPMGSSEGFTFSPNVKEVKRVLVLSTAMLPIEDVLCYELSYKIDLSLHIKSP